MGVVSWAHIPRGGIDQGVYIQYFNRVEISDERFCKLISSTIWSPIVWTNNRRLKANFEFSDYCALDFEHPDVTLTGVKKRFCDSWHILGTTRNHQKQKENNPPMDRFRLVLQWERRITCVKEYEYNTKKLADELQADIAACDGGRVFLPSQYHSHEFGDDLYVEEVLVPTNTGGNDYKYEQKYHNAGILSPFARHALMNVIPVGSRNSTFFKVACELSRLGVSMEEAQNRIVNCPTFRQSEGGRKLENTVCQIKRSIKSAYESRRECDK